MSLQYLICDGDQVLSHVNDPCSREKGRVRGVILFSETFDIDTIISLLQSGTDEAAREIVHRVSAGIDAGDVHIINQTRGTYNAEPHTVDGYGDIDTRLLWYDHQLNFEDPTYAGNRDFWQKAEKRKYYVAWRTETLLHFSDKLANVVVTSPIEAEVTSTVTWNVDMTWRSKLIPEIVNVGIFEKIFVFGGIPNIFTAEYTEQYL